MASVATEKLTMPHRIRDPNVSNHVSPIKTQARPLNATPSSPVSPVSPEYQRSASYTYLPTASKEQRYRGNLSVVKGSFSEEDLIIAPQQITDSVSRSSSGWTTPEEQDTSIRTERISPSDLVIELQKNPKITIGQFADLEEAARRGIAQRRDESVSSSITSRARQRSSVSTNASRSVQRRSWYSVATTPDSRSPSPPKKGTDRDSSKEDVTVIMKVDASGAPTANRRRSLLPRRESFMPIEERDDNSIAESEPPVKPTLSRRSSVFGKRPLSSIFSKTSEQDDDPPAMPSVPKSFSTDRLSTMASSHRGTVPSRPGSMRRLESQTSVFLSRRKDELWSVFRALDAEFSKFQSKSVALKANVIRSGLITFLREYSEHPSTYQLRSDDLERRANILNKWWVALIELLCGRNNQSVSGTDRPVILDAIVGIMERPEWRLPPSSLCPIERRSPSSRTACSDLDAAHQHAHNIFVQNLRIQMTFVVEKMSLRNASASLVTFCGKACAYAFMFVPGIADVLVRLWDLQGDLLRRVLAENGIDRFANLATISGNVIGEYPECLHNLRFTTLAEFNRRLRTRPTLPAGTTNIQWWGHWLERWTGNESDLFYVFVKHYHVLASDFLQVGASKEERMCVPGMLLVHGQILNNLDATIHRRLGRSAAPEPAASQQVRGMDGVLADPDAVASTLPELPINAARSMAENRLIMLTRDFLSERAAAFPAARQLYAESFNDLLQAATRGINVYDVSSSYTLLGLLEEALAILVKYEQLSGMSGTLISPDFWHLMSRRMISSENTIIEIRLYAFLYTVWGTIVCEDERKTDLVLGLLLDPVVFASRFNHWSPMVRAYYMRLLCWRVARFDGDLTPTDLEILETLLVRLQTTWSHYLWFKDDGSQGDAPLSDSPQNPAPNRRLRIIKNNSGTAPGSFPSFDVIAPLMPPSTTAAASRPPVKRQSTLSTMISAAELESRIAAEMPNSLSTSPGNGLRGFIKGVLGSNNPSRSQSISSGASTPPVLGSIPIPAPSRKISMPALLRSATNEVIIPSRDSSLTSGTSTPTNGSHTAFSFKFAFEYGPDITMPRPLKMVPPRLPAPAQRCLSANSDRLRSPEFTTIAQEPRGVARKRAMYCGRALAEWALIVGECQSFFDRRHRDGVPDDRSVETPTLSVEIFKRAG